MKLLFCLTSLILLFDHIRLTQGRCIPGLQFQCSNGECILASFVCDGDNDCTDASDERNCRITTGCTPGQFRCSNSQCIPASYVCDGDNDCADASDERNCRTTTDLHNTDCSPGQFRCSSSRCIRDAFVCDGDNDCTDNSDERNCPELLESNFLIVADSIKRNLFQVGLDDGIMVPILPVKPTQPLGVAYDPFNGFVYWTDLSLHMIGRYSLTGASSRIRPVTTTMPISTSFPTTKSSIATATSSNPSATSSRATTTSQTPKVDQPSTNVLGVFSETTLITIVCVGVAGIVLISLFCSFAICAAKKRSRSSSVNAGTINPGQQLAVTYTVPAVQNNQAKQTTTYDNCDDSYDYIQDNHVYYLEPRSSNSSDGYMKPLYVPGQHHQQSPSQPGDHYVKIPKTSFT